MKADHLRKIPFRTHALMDEPIHDRHNAMTIAHWPLASGAENESFSCKIENYFLHDFRHRLKFLQMIYYHSAKLLQVLINIDTYNTFALSPQIEVLFRLNPLPDNKF